MVIGLVGVPGPYVHQLVLEDDDIVIGLVPILYPLVMAYLVLDHLLKSMVDVAIPLAVCNRLINRYSIIYDCFIFSFTAASPTISEYLKSCILKSVNNE